MLCLKLASVALCALALTVDVGGSPSGASAPENVEKKGSSEEVVAKSTAFFITSGSVYVRTSGTTRSCRAHTDCYGLREPDDWCPLPPNDRYYEKGCFCDSGRSLCTIERQGANGPEHTDCFDKLASRCPSSSEPQLQEVANNLAVENRVRSYAEAEGLALTPYSVYVKTSGQWRPCREHEECYSMREPSEWCPLPSYDKYYDKGCFCDHLMGRCVIERQTPGGAQYTDCTYKSVFQCLGTGTNYEQPAAAVVSKRVMPESGSDLTVTPGGWYVTTSGRPKTCVQHTDCYEMREPVEWCPLPVNDRYYNKGCFCDHVRNLCTIEREVPNGSEYTDCGDSSTFQCSRQ